MRFKDKVALIVGGANGIAAATARIMAGEGGRLVLFDRDVDKLHALRDDLLAIDGAQVLAIAGDALNESEAVAAVQQALARFGRIDILVQAVGGSTIVDTPIEELSVDTWNKVVAFNLLPCFLFCRAVTPVMKKQRHGRIVNISSHAAYGIDVRTTAYAASKAGVIGFTRKLALELGPYGINCNAIVPSRTRTPENFDLVANHDYIQRIPLRRLAVPEDQARVVCFLASRDADYVTGQTIDVTGGQ